MVSIMPPDPDGKTRAHAPTLMGVYELMQDRANTRADLFLDRAACLIYGIASSHEGLSGCDACELGERACAEIETAVEIAFAWLMQEARR